MTDSVWLEWLLETMKSRPNGNAYVESERGIAVAKLLFDFERTNLCWRRSDEDCFWIDVQLFVKYGLSDEEIIFCAKMQAGTENYKRFKRERNEWLKNRNSENGAKRQRRDASGTRPRFSRLNGL